MGCNGDIVLEILVATLAKAGQNELKMSWFIYSPCVFVNMY